MLSSRKASKKCACVILIRYDAYLTNTPTHKLVVSCYRRRRGRWIFARDKNNDDDAPRQKWNDNELWQSNNFSFGTVRTVRSIEKRRIRTISIPKRRRLHTSIQIFGWLTLLIGPERKWGYILFFKSNWIDFVYIIYLEFSTYNFQLEKRN